MMRIPNLSLEQIYPSAFGAHNLNTRHNPDCGNFGEAADLEIQRPNGKASQPMMMALRSNTAIVGLGRYKLGALSGDPRRHVSSAFEYTNDPHSWIDGRQVECQFDGGAGPCGIDFEVLSNEHLAVEVVRLMALTAPAVAASAAVAAEEAAAVKASGTTTKPWFPGE